MNHILDLFNATSNGEDFVKLNEYLSFEDRNQFNLDYFKQFLATNRHIKDFGKDTVGFIYRHPKITGFNSKNISCEDLCFNSDSEIMKEMGINEEPTGEEWDKYYEFSTAARSDILDTVSDYAVLIEKNGNERIFVMLNSWYDPIFTKSFLLDQYWDIVIY